MEFPDEDSLFLATPASSPADEQDHSLLQELSHFLLPSPREALEHQDAGHDVNGTEAGGSTMDLQGGYDSSPGRQQQQPSGGGLIKIPLLAPATTTTWKHLHPRWEAKVVPQKMRSQPCLISARVVLRCKKKMHAPSRIGFCGCRLNLPASEHAAGNQSVMVLGGPVSQTVIGSVRDCPMEVNGSRCKTWSDLAWKMGKQS